MDSVTICQDDNLQKIEDHRQILEKCGMSRRGGRLWQMDEHSEARPCHASAKEKWDEVERVARLSPLPAWPARGLAWPGTNLHDMGVPTKVIQKVCRHADEATTKKHYIHATEPGVRSGMRKLEESIIREKHERRPKS